MLPLITRAIQILAGVVNPLGATSYFVRLQRKGVGGGGEKKKGAWEVEIKDCSSVVVFAWRGLVGRGWGLGKGFTPHNSSHLEKPSYNVDGEVIPSSLGWTRDLLVHCKPLGDFAVSGTISSVPQCSLGVPLRQTTPRVWHLTTPRGSRVTGLFSTERGGGGSRWS